MLKADRLVTFSIIKVTTKVLCCKPCMTYYKILSKCQLI